MDFTWEPSKLPRLRGEALRGARWLCGLSEQWGNSLQEFTTSVAVLKAAGMLERGWLL